MDTQIKIWISGPYGKMGSALRSAIDDYDDIVITGLISPEHAGSKEESVNGLEVVASLGEAATKGDLPDVIVDFTIANVAYNAALFAAQNNINFVSGTTGMTDEQKNKVKNAFDDSLANAIIASNFSVGAVLMMRFARQAAKHFTRVEITETHHTDKKDAPSGTSKTTRDMIIESSSLTLEDIPIHSLRLPGAIAHQQVHLSTEGEILRIEHDSNNRSCFMPGVILSIRKVKEVPGVLFTIEPLLFD